MINLKRIKCFFLLLYTVAIHWDVKAQTRSICKPKVAFENMQWQCLGPFVTNNAQTIGAITAINANPLKDSLEIYAGSQTGGLWHTINGGAYWQCITNNYNSPVIGINKIIVDYLPNNNKIYLATGFGCDWMSSTNAGIIFSEDNGKTWQRSIFVDNKNSEQFGERCYTLIRSKIDQNVFYTSGNGKIYKSNDRCKTFKTIFPFDENQKKDFQFYETIPIANLALNNDESILFFTHDRKGVWYIDRSIDFSAKAFALKMNNTKALPAYELSKNIVEEMKIENLNATACDIVLVEKDVKFAFLFDNDSKGKTVIADFDEKNLTLHNYKPLDENARKLDFYWMYGLQYNNLNTNIVYAGGTTLNKSTNAGKNFSSLFEYAYGYNNIPHCDIREIFISKSSVDGETDRLFIGTDGGISFSSNGGKTFKNMNGPFLPISQIYGVGSSPFTGNVTVGMQDNSVTSFDYKNKKWIYEIRGDGYDVEYDKAKRGYLYGEYNGQVLYYSINDFAPLNRYAGLNTNSVSIGINNIKTTYAGNIYQASRLFHKLSSEKKKWTTTKYDENIEESTFNFDVCESDTNIIYLSTVWSDNTKGVYKSYNGGQTFENISSKIRANNGRTNFGGGRVDAICVSPYDANKVWLAMGYFNNYDDICNSDYRIIFSEDGGNTWVDYSLGLSGYPFQDIKFIEGTTEALIACNDEGVFIRENRFEDWKLLAKGLPMGVKTELNINYCAGKIYVSTYGNGLWYIDLPNLNFDKPYVIKNKTILDGNEKIITTDIIIKKRGKLELNTTLNLAKGKKIFLKNKNQLVIKENGKIINDCEEDYKPEVIIKK